MFKRRGLRVVFGRGGRDGRACPGHCSLLCHWKCTEMHHFRVKFLPVERLSRPPPCMDWYATRFTIYLDRQATSVATFISALLCYIDDDINDAFFTFVNRSSIAESLHTRAGPTQDYYTLLGPYSLQVYMQITMLQLFVMSTGCGIKTIP